MDEKDLRSFWQEGEMLKKSNSTISIIVGLKKCQAVSMNVENFVCGLFFSHKWA